MNTIKRLLGIVWIVMGPVILFWLIRTGMEEVAKKPVTETRIQWGIFVLIFIPIVVGLVLFGYYAFKGEYDSSRSDRNL